VLDLGGGLNRFGGGHVGGIVCRDWGCIKLLWWVRSVDCEDG
jgi:hypothetical protein